MKRIVSWLIVWLLSLLNSVEQREMVKRLVELCCIGYHLHKNAGSRTIITPAEDTITMNTNGEIVNA